MPEDKADQILELEEVLRGAAGDLSMVHVAVLVEHPEAVRSALAAVADVLSSERPSGSIEEESDVETIGDAEPRRVEVQESAKQMPVRTTTAGREQLLSSSELAARVGLKTRQSVHDWRKKGRIVGWEGAKRGYVFPEGQLDRHDRPLNGIERIVPHFSDGFVAWTWLTTPRPSLNGAKPIVLLRKGEGDQVAAAAAGDAQGDFA